jgi:2-amino-4-hydroxy-6-hydroxymethyldihydropteridine diphosphokinase
VRAVLSLGSNLGDRRAHLRGGLEVIGQQLPVLMVSPLYETEPIGDVAQPTYLNCVAVVDVPDPEAALTAAHAAESARGRMRSVRWGPRTLDVDVVSVDALRIDDPRLTLPHPRAHERAFVLAPWLDLDPAAELPGFGPVRALVQRVGRDGVRRRAW